MRDVEESIFWLETDLQVKEILFLRATAGSTLSLIRFTNASHVHNFVYGDSDKSFDPSAVIS